MAEDARRRATKKEDKEESKKTAAGPKSKEEIPSLRYGPMLTFPNQRRFTRFLVIMSVMVIVYFYTSKKRDKTFAAVGMSVSQRTMPLTCSNSLMSELSQFKDCVPLTCGRGVYDSIVTSTEVETLQRLADKGFALSSPSGGVAIFDLHSGALSQGEDFINVYKAAGNSFLNPDDISTYRSVRTKIQHTIAAQFMVNPSSLHLSHPTFFSRMTSAPAKTIHDEYWHSHVDKETYPSFHYTALLYLSNYKADFTGGRFLFLHEDSATYAVEPVKGRLLVFTSGEENTHRVEEVSSGVRTALTIAFTCDSALAIKDVNVPSASKGA